MAASHCTRKRAPLAWFPVDPEAPESVPSEPGCYAVLSQGKPVYVGQSRNIRRRLRGYDIHQNMHDPGVLVTPWGYLPDWSVRVTLAGDRREAREARLIRRLNPRGNYVHRTGGLVKSWRG